MPSSSCPASHHWRDLVRLAPINSRKFRGFRRDRASIPSRSLGPFVAFRAIVSLLKIQRTMDRTVVLTVSGRLDAANVGALCQLIDDEPAGAVVVLDLTDLLLADRESVRLLRECETGERIVFRNCPAYIRAWMAAEENR